MTLEALEVFVPGPLYNPLNGPHGHWAQRAWWVRNVRTRTHGALLHAQALGRCSPAAPKRIEFLAQTGGTWDDDNLRAGLKPVRDALQDAGIIHSDAPRSGHVFVYAQVIDRAHRGVRITITPRGAPRPARQERP